VLPWARPPARASALLTTHQVQDPLVVGLQRVPAQAITMNTERRSAGARYARRPTGRGPRTPVAADTDMARLTSISTTSSRRTAMRSGSSQW